MAKKILTKEELFAQQKEIELLHIQDSILYTNEPSYFFNVGDKVSYGAMDEAIVDEILYEGKAYGLKCVSIHKNSYNTTKEELYRVALWTELRPLTNKNTNFSKNQEIRLYFNNSTVESLINKHYFFGVDFNPDYQRGYVWTQEDKELLIDSVFNNIDIGKFVFITTDDNKWKNTKFSYEILDGKQRLSTLIEFYENRIPYKGTYYNDLSAKDKRIFKNHSVSWTEVSETDKKMILKYFLMLNRTGKSMDEKHLKTIENMLNELE